MKYPSVGLFIAVIFLSACGAETEPEESAPTTPAFADSKGDDASSCSSIGYLIADEEITEVKVDAECGTSWYSRSGRFAGEVEFDVDISNPGEITTKFVGVCVRKLNYTRFYGLNPDHPELAGWQEDTVDSNAPCGWYEIKSNGALVSLDDGVAINSILEPGWYDIGFSTPDDFTGEGEFVIGLFAGAVEEERTCGDGIVDPRNEFCDDGNASPMDACGLDCFWNEAYFSEVDDNELPEEAVSLEGFQIVHIDHVFREEDDADWFAYTAPSAGNLTLRNTRAEGTLLTLYRAGEPDVPIDSITVSECGERCSLAVPEAGEYLLEFWRADPGASYKVRLEGTNVNLD